MKRYRVRKLGVYHYDYFRSKRQAVKYAREKQALVGGDVFVERYHSRKAMWTRVWPRKS